MRAASGGLIVSRSDTWSKSPNWAAMMDLLQGFRLPKSTTVSSRPFWPRRQRRVLTAGHRQGIEKTKLRVGQEKIIESLSDVLRVDLYLKL